ncbi:hypothetical protein HW555_013591 [Spodoptera exigua]|uniref:DDE Tnp4 domain-containing protein n=1 Tax=Spodoptera exigua TaxID=7107 RepID=A0A835G346_SPOEX|nr:hypothetical protein HW555_013591 [Spodoptera exigua]
MPPLHVDRFVCRRPQTHPQMNLYEPSTRRQVVQSMLVLVRCNTYARRMDIETVAAAAINLFCTYKNSMENQFAELYAEPSGEFNNFVRMSSSDFEYLLQKISPTIAKKDTDWRDAIPVKVRLAVTLRYLATGDSYRSLHYLFKISSQVISIIVPEVCLALNNVCLPNSNTSLPYVFLADAAFALSTHIMKPFPGHHALGTPERLFNQKLSSSRVAVENTFGIMSSVFRIFKKPIPLNITKASLITMTCVLLHNFLRKSKTSQHLYSPQIQKISISMEN